MLAALSAAAYAQPTYTVTVTVQGLPPGFLTKIFVDGAPNGTMAGGDSRTYTFQISSTFHTITVDFYVPNSVGQNGTRFYNKDTSWSFNSPGTRTFTYVTQYYLTVESSYSIVSGNGWYDAGQTAQAAVKDPQVDEGQGTREVFAGWSGDASGTGLTSNPILMNSPKRAVATWKTQFLLTIQSDPPSVGGFAGEGWYDAGSQASFSAPQIVPADQTSRLKFAFWSGSFSGSSPTGTTMMDRPKVVIAHYIAQYLLEVQYDPQSLQERYNETHAGWYDADSYVQLGPVPPTIQVSTVEQLRFVGWVVEGVPSSDLSVTVHMDKAHKIILRYTTQFYIEVRSQYGDATGAGWYDEGTTATITVASTSGTWPVAYTLTDWRVDPPTGVLIQKGDSWTILVDRPYVIEAVWSVDYVPLIWLFGGGALVIGAIAAGIAFGLRRGIFKSGGFRPKTKPAPRTIQARRCTNCGASISEGSGFCHKCGAPAPVTTPTARVRTANVEDRVYEYIVKHEGVISLSKAAKELDISVEKLKEITEKLKRDGRLA